MMDKTFDEQVSVPRSLLYDIISNAATGYPDWTTLEGRIRAAVLAEGGAREPVAWMYEHDGQVYDKLHPPFFTTEPWSVVEEPWTETPLYTAPIAPPHAGIGVKVHQDRSNDPPPMLDYGPADGATTQNAAASEDQRYVRKWTGDQYDYVPAAPPAPDENGGRIAALTAERDRLREELVAADKCYAEMSAGFNQEIMTREAAERRTAEAEANLASVRAETIEECAKVCDPNGMSAEEYCKISNYVIQRDIQRDIALMKNLAEAIRTLAPERTVAHTDHPMRHWDRTCPACNPASPLLPGLERAAEICVVTGRRNADLVGEFNGSLKCRNAIRAEISRLKGEGRES